MGVSFLEMWFCKNQFSRYPLSPEVRIQVTHITNKSLIIEI